VLDPATIDTSMEARAITFENPSGARGAGGAAACRRKGAPMQVVPPGEAVTLADIDGPGTVRHIWLTVGLAPPEVLRALVLEVFYDGAERPSVPATCPCHSPGTCGSCSGTSPPTSPRSTSSSI
jgi:hypothetical protein